MGIRVQIYNKHGLLLTWLYLLCQTNSRKQLSIAADKTGYPYLDRIDV